VGNLAWLGVWVEQRIPIEINAPHAYCFMGGDANVGYWVDKSDYTKLLEDHHSQAYMEDPGTFASNRAILAVGVVSSSGVVTLDDWYVIQDAELSTLEPGPYSFEYQDSAGNILGQVSFDVEFVADGVPLTESPFVLTIPFVANTAQIIIKEDTIPVAVKPVSTHAPQASIVSPVSPGPYSGQIAIEWSGYDQDGDVMSYALFYSSDNGASWEAIASNLSSTSYLWNISSLPDGTHYRVKAMATDGINTGEAVSPNFSIEQTKRIFLPFAVK
jgi:hypothetical protein